MKKAIIIVIFQLLHFAVYAQQSEVTWDKTSLMFDGRRAIPVMGEIHYSRLDVQEWPNAVKKMVQGGVTVIATYVFWNHIEEQEGVFDWSGRRNLRAFLEVCQQENVPVVLRIGPFCHGEVRNGGIPDWVFSKGCKLRSEDSIFLDLTRKLYRQIFTQVQGLQWKDSGPVIAAQFDNEYGGSGGYLMALKRIAKEVGFDLPFYTRTGWPELRKPTPYGEMIPLYGDYADGFWNKEITECAGSYWKAFHFKSFRSSTAIGTDLLGEQKEHVSDSEQLYPFFTCELGGGMTTSYHRRPYIYPQDALALAVVKLGSGSNLLGYYMYSGGTNPVGYFNTLNENQHTLGTANNDLPTVSYEFQAPLGAYGQRSESWYILRPLHLFLQDFGEILAPMDAKFPNGDAPTSLGDDSFLRWTYRNSGDSGFVFVNNYERLQNLSAKKNITFEVCGIRFPSHPITIPMGKSCIFPVNICGIKYATAQLVAYRDSKIYLMAIDGLPVEIATNDKILKNVKPKGAENPIYKNIYLLNEEDAQRLFLKGEVDESTLTKDLPEVEFQKKKEAGRLRKIEYGPAKVAEAPSDSDFEQAAIYEITVPDDTDSLLLDIDYRGDCARLYVTDSLLDDNFYNSRHFVFGLWRVPKGSRILTLKILPLQENEPIYLPKEADKTPGENLNAVILKRRR